MEQDLVRRQGFDFYPLRSSGFFGKGAAARMQFVLNAATGLLSAIGIIRRLRPSALIAAGGFGSVTPLLAARIMNRPYFLLEQNCIPGRVTRYFARGAVETFLTFPLVRHLAGRTLVTGTPLRERLLTAARHDDGKTVLVLGGSQGARALNAAALDLARQLPELHFVVQTGRRDYPDVRTTAAKYGLANIELIDFTLAMEELYARASLVLSRAGGMVVNEILALGLPSILVPFPFATDNHQKANAQHAARQGAALQIDQSRLPELGKIVPELLADRPRLAQMTESARRIACRDATSVIAKRIADLLGPTASRSEPARDRPQPGAASVR
jgi:UDP-N-acetylglucosamine--N-acetylmuramyl-(pentapeptide) pyrophosphoryl-undecaprenol N-acetylglucosamine transferase